jgi:hypothetical protein
MLNQIFEVEKDDITNSDPIPSKTITPNQIKMLNKEAIDFLKQQGLDVEVDQSPPLKGSTLEEFELRFELVEDLEELPF